MELRQISYQNREKTTKMNWYKRSQQVSINADQVSAMYPVVSGVIEGLTIRSDIPNISSIGSSMSDYEILSGIRSIPLTEFGDASPHSTFYAANDIQRSRTLAQSIAESGEISPLIVGIEPPIEEGPYILEGLHRLVALHELGKTVLPAIVVIDRSGDSE